MSSKGFNGCIEGLSLVELVQFACIEGGDRMLAVQCEEQRGDIFFVNSEVIHAEHDDVSGEEAFYDIMAWPSGSFIMRFVKTEKRTIDASWNFLLMEAVRRIDEESQEEGSKQVKQDYLLKVLVVDDSRLFTRAFLKLFGEDVGARVVGTATNGKEALKFLEVETPDLVTLDINMPVMGGDVALKHIMIRSPAPVVLVSNFNEQICPKLMDFMRLGAVDVVAKPTNPESWKIVSDRLRYLLAKVKGFRLDNISRAKISKEVASRAASCEPAKKLIIIFSGLGGMLELQKIVPAMEFDHDTAILVFQDMYSSIAEYLVKHIDRFTPYSTSMLQSGVKLLGGCLVVGNYHDKWDLEEAGGVPTLIGTQDSNDSLFFKRAAMLDSAGQHFGAAMSVVVLGGVDGGLQKALETVTAAGGEIILQNPDSSLCPGPLVALQSAFPQAKIVKPENVANHLAGGQSLETERI